MKPAPKWWLPVAALGLVGAVVAAVYFAAFRPVPPSASAGERAGDLFEAREPAGAQDTAAAARIADGAAATAVDAGAAGAEASGGPVSSWDRVKADCPWPPDPDTWRGLGEDCEAALGRSSVSFNYDGWMDALEDPAGTRRTVVATLDRPECRVPRGESRPDLYEACAAEALVRLAKLQSTCVGLLRGDLNERVDRDREVAMRTTGGG